MKPPATNPNTGAVARPMEPDEIAAFAKTGCNSCHGAGAVLKTIDVSTTNHKIAPGGVREERPKRRELCPCVAKAIGGRTDILTRQDGMLCWAPAGHVAPLVLQRRPRDGGP